MNDNDLVDRFLSGTLASFSHRDHVRVGFLLLSMQDFDDTTQIVSDRIRAMAAAVGDTSKFHVTRTVAWLHLIDSARSTGPNPPDSESFLNDHPELLRSGLLDDHYSAELLRSPAARAEFLAPDLAPLR